MKLLTTYTVLGLQLLVYLADITPQTRVNTAEIAQYYKVSRYHMTKVVGHLMRLGYVTARRGKGGGMILNKAPESIYLGYLVQALEGRYAINFYCKPSHAIKFHERLTVILATSLEALLVRLNQFTLADLLITQ